MNLEPVLSTRQTSGDGDYHTSISDTLSRIENNARTTVRDNPELLRRLIENNELLNDVFFVNENGLIEVKDSSESKILTGHFKGIPVVPGVILRTLFEVISGTQNLASFTEFKGIVLPGNKLKVSENGIINGENDKEIMSYSLGNFEISGIGFINSEENEVLNNEDIDRLILQSAPFRFATEAKIFRGNKESREIEEGSFITGSFIVPDDFEFLDKNGGVQKSIYDEIVAQILSLGASHILNGSTPPEDKRFKILTFGESNIKMVSGESVLPGSKLECIAKVKNSNTKGASVEFELLSNGIQILVGEIKGNIIPKAAMSRLKR